MKKILAFICASIPLSFLGQVHNELHDKYWNYRERLVKDFVRVGDESGMSIPISARSVGFAYSNCEPNEEQLRPSRVYFQDATIYLGHYLAVLASESKLLMEQWQQSDALAQQDIQVRLNQVYAEIYFALNAIERLDKNCESYYTNEPSIDSDLNGLILRDDAPVGFHDEHYYADYSERFDRPFLPSRTHSDFTPVEVWSEGGFNIAHNPSNVMSLDQVTSVLMGLFTVYRWCPEVSVNFDPALGNMSLKEKSREIALRMIDYIVRPNNECGSDCWNFNIVVPEHVFRPAGYDCSFIAPMLIKLAKEFAHPYWAQRWSLNNLSNLRIAVQLKPSVFSELSESITDLGPSLIQNFAESIAASCANELTHFASDHFASESPITIGYFELGPLEALIHDLAAQQVDISVDGNPCYNVGPVVANLLDSFHFDIYGLTGCANEIIELFVNASVDVFTNHSNIGLDILSLFNENSAVICIEENSPLHHLLNDDNVHIFSEWMAISNFTLPQYIHHIAGAEASNMDWYTLLNSALYNNTLLLDLLDKDFLLEEYLVSAPCGGPWDDPLNTNLPTEGTVPGWRAANRLFHPSDADLGIPDPSFRGEYAGLDYMLYHNLFYMNYPEDINELLVSTNCECTSNYFPINEISTAAYVQPKFLDYVKWGVETTNYITEPMLFESSNAVLEVLSDLEICSGGEDMLITLTDHASWKIYGNCTVSIGDGVTMLVENNAKLQGGFDYPQLNITSDNARIVVKNGGTLYVRNNAIVEAVYGLIIEVESGGVVIFENASCLFNPQSSDSKVFLHPGAYFEMKNGSLFQHDGLNNLLMVALEESLIKIKDSNFFINHGGFELEHATLQAENTTLKNLSGIYESRGGIIDFNNCLFISENSDWNFYSGSRLNLVESDFRLNDAQWRIADEHIHNALYESDLSSINTNNSFIRLIGNQSRLIFGNALWSNPDQSYSELLATGGAGGQIIIEENALLNLQLEESGHLKWVGTNKINPFIQLEPYAFLEIHGHNGQMDLQQGKMTLSNQSSCIVHARLNMNQMRVANGDSEYHATVNVTNPMVSLQYVDFNDVKVDGITSHMKITSCKFQNERSGLALRGGSFKVVSSQFENCGMQTSKLESVSSISHSDFIGGANSSGAIAISDASLVEIWMNNSKVRNYGYGIQKLGGVLSLRCNNFEDNAIGLLVDHTKLNMSANAAAGYNNFTDNHINIEAVNMLEYGLDKGYNRFEPYLNCNIWTTSLLPCNGQPIYIPANCNIWSVSNAVHQASQQSMCVSETYPIGSGCEVLFEDYSPASTNVCPTSRVTVKPPSRKNLGIHQPNANSAGQFKNLTDTTFISTSHFNGVSLDSALAFAANQLEVYDSLGNDMLAMQLFQEIFSQEPNRASAYNRQLINWGIVMMKNAFEGLLNEGEIDLINHQDDFDPITQSYVDVLNWNTDTVLSNETYKDQFYNELIKGQLFLTLGKPLMAFNIYENLNTCGLDTLEVIQLDFWKNQALQYATILNDLTDSIWNESVSTDPFWSMEEVLESSVESDYSFGTIIHSLNSVSFISCGDNPVYKGTWDEELNIQLFPNPASDHICIQLDGGNWIDEVRIADMNGRMLKHEKINSDWSTVVNLSLDKSWPPGKYMVLVVGPSYRQSIPWLKK